MKSTSFFSFLTGCLFAAVVGVSVAAVGCGSDSDDGKSDSGMGGGAGNDGTGGGGGGSGTGGGGGGSGTCANRCPNGSKDCPVVKCKCTADGPTTDVRVCIDACCLSQDDTCEAHCGKDN